MPLSAVIEIDGLLVRPRCGYPIVRHELFLAEYAINKPVSVPPNRIAAADCLTNDTKILENRVHGGAIHVEVDSEIDCRSFGLPDQLGLIQRSLCISRDFRLCRTGIFQSAQKFR